MTAARQVYALDLSARRSVNHQLPRPWTHDRGSDEFASGHGGTDRKRCRSLQVEGRVDAYVRRREGFLRWAWHRGRPDFDRHRPCAREQIPRQWRSILCLHGRRRSEPGRGGREPQYGCCTFSSGDLRDREQPLRNGCLGGAPRWSVRRRRCRCIGEAWRSTFRESSWMVWTSLLSARQAPARARAAAGEGPTILEIETTDTAGT